MYDELVKSIHCCFGFDSMQTDCENCMMKDKREEHNYVGCCDALGLAAADAIEELSKPKWIPVTERLPDGGVPTLICGDGNVVEQGFFDDEFGYWYDWGGNRTFAHHWMPLPQPPKEE